jgi:hypothetical protein
MKGREIVAVICMSVLGVLALVIVDYLHPGTDNTATNTMIIGFLAPTIMSLLSAMKSADNASKLESMHSDLKENSVMTGAVVDTLKTQAAQPIPPNVTTIINEDKK